MKKEIKELIEKKWYEFTFLYLWIVTSTLMCFGTMLLHFIATFTIKWELLIFYPVIGIVVFIFYLFGFVYVKLSKNPGGVV